MYLYVYHIFICDLFLIMNKVDFASYADSNISYVLGNDIKEVAKTLREASGELSY